MKTNFSVITNLKKVVFFGLLLNSAIVQAQDYISPQKLVEEFYINYNGLARNLDASKITNLLTDDFNKLEFTSNVQNIEEYESELNKWIEEVTLYPENIKFLSIVETHVNIEEEDYAVIICMVSPKGRGEGLDGMDIWQNHTFVLKRIGDEWKIQLLYINQIDVG